jgi:hypothetical protein
MASQSSLKNKMSKSKAVSAEIQSKRLENDDAKFDKVDAAIDKKPAAKKAVKKRRTPIKKAAPAPELQKMTLNYTEAEKVIIHDVTVRCAITGTLLTTSEVLRLGIHALKSMSDNQLKKTIPSLERLKRGKKS